MTERRIHSGMAARGVTLIELMVAVVVFMIFVSAVYGTYHTASQAMVNTEARTDTYQTGRVLLAQINRELGCLYQSGSAQAASAVSVTLIGEDSEDPSAEMQNDTLTFTTVAPRMLHSDEPAGDVRQVRYSIGLGDDDKPLGLSLEDNLHPDTAMEDATVEPVILSDLVIGLNCAYLDDASGEWVDSWVDQPALPAAVRIELLLRPTRESERPVVLSTTAALTMSKAGTVEQTTGGSPGAGPSEGQEQPEGGNGIPSGGGEGGFPTGGGGMGVPTGGGGRNAGGRHAP